MSSVQEVLGLVDAIKSSYRGNEGHVAATDLHATGIALVDRGPARAPEEILMAQANKLDVIFSALVDRAGGAKHEQQIEGLMRLALKAQSQCAQTLRVLGELKAPKQVAFFNQSNFAHGHQQVVNGLTSTGCDVRPANELSSRDGDV